MIVAIMSLWLTRHALHFQAMNGRNVCTSTIQHMLAAPHGHWHMIYMQRIKRWWVRYEFCANKSHQLNTENESFIHRLCRKLCTMQWMVHYNDDIRCNDCTSSKKMLFHRKLWRMLPISCDKCVPYQNDSINMMRKWLRRSRKLWIIPMIMSLDRVMKSVRVIQLDE